MRSLTRLKALASVAHSLKRAYLTRFWGLDIHPTARFSLSANFDRTYPKGVHIGEESFVTLGVVILAHDFSRGLYLDTVVGKRCFVGARSIIMPGVKIGDGCIVGAGSIVTKDVPSGCAVAGNPARIIARDLEVGPYGRMKDADANTRRLLGLPLSDGMSSRP